MKKAPEYRYLEAFVLSNGVKGFEPSTPCTPSNLNQIPMIITGSHWMNIVFNFNRLEIITLQIHPATYTTSQ
jgi:hypothetical protein